MTGVPPAQYITCFGCPMLDIVADVTGEFLQDHSLEADGNVMVEASNKAVYRAIYSRAVSDVKHVVGGAAQNTARICQWALQGFSDKSQQSCVSVGCVGKDEHGRMLESGTKADNVLVEYAYHDTLATGVCAVLVSEENRCLVSNYGAWMDYPSQHLDTIWERVVLRSSIVYMSGFFVKSCNIAAQRLAEVVCCGGDGGGGVDATLCMNLSAEYLYKDNPGVLINIIQQSDVLFGNCSEAHALGFASGAWPADDSAVSVAKKLSALHHHNGAVCLCHDFPADSRAPGHKTVILTRGQQPVVVCSRNQGTLTLQEFPVRNVEKIVDTNGVGDAFVAGYLCGLSTGQSMCQCLELAVACAARVIQEHGCSVPKSPLVL